MRWDRGSSGQKPGAPRAAVMAGPYNRAGISGTEADPPLVLTSPLTSVARGVATLSLVTRLTA